MANEEDVADWLDKSASMYLKEVNKLKIPWLIVLLLIIA